MPGIVWILGSGFSKALDGPVLDDLMAPSCLETIASRLRAPSGSAYKVPSPATSLACWLFNYGTRFRWGSNFPTLRPMVEYGELLWANAEQYLDRLPGHLTSGRFATAFGKYRQGQAINALPSNPELEAAALRLLAGECYSFFDFQNVQHNSELWAPYLRFGRTLVKAGDSVLTFNYDLVCEVLERWSFLEIVDPSSVTAQLGKPPVFKLHGSVSWKKNAATTNAPLSFSLAAPDFAMTCADDELGLAAPGAAKIVFTAGLSQLWDSAMAAISRAEAIVFLGYRFPPTDSMARMRILQAIEENVEDELRCHVILGQSSADWERLTGLLEFAGQRRFDRCAKEIRRIKVHRMNAEDFCSVAPRTAL